jgi:hypothetical protein
MSEDVSEYVHVRHLEAFIEAARTYRCHILVRKTGRASLRYFGISGYAGKLADMKAKTAARDVHPYQLQGLVCSPLIHPGACKKGAVAEWQKSVHLITSSPNGFDDDRQPRGCATRYLLQTNPRHRHYGCVAWVENGLLVPRYVHGDYDLYAIIPAGTPFTPNNSPTRAQPMRATMDLPASLTLSQRLSREDMLRKHAVQDRVSHLSFEVGTFLNLRIARIEGEVPGALMVNHGEQVNLGSPGQDFQHVLAFLASSRKGQSLTLLRNQFEHEAFYADA